MSDGRSFRAYFSSEHLRGVDLPMDGHTFRITDEAQTTMEDGKTVCMLTLRDAENEGITWITNIINGEYMKRIFGTDLPEKWVGHLVTLRYDPTVKRGKETVGGIRVMGSPELTAPVTFQYQENQHKKPRPVTLKPTGTAKPPANVDPAIGDGDGDGDVDGDDIGFTDEAPHAHENNVGPAGDDLGPDGYTEAVEADYAPEGEIPGIGVEEVKSRRKAS